MSLLRSTVVLAGAVGVALTSVTPAEAQLFRLAIDEIAVTVPTDGDGEDDVYFTIGGFTSSLGTKTAVSMPEVGPGAPDYFYRMGSRGAGLHTRRSLPLWTGRWLCCLSPGERAFLVVFVRERDSADSSETIRLLDWASPWFVNDSRSGNWRTTASLVCSDLLDEPDDVIGAFTVELTSDFRTVSAAWSGLSPYWWSRVTAPNTTLAASSHAAAEFTAALNEPERSRRWEYRLRVSVQQLVQASNLHSEKCLDVAKGSLSSGANVQQYTCTGSPFYRGQPNQLWILSPAGVSWAPTFYLQALHSAKCLDVASASSADGANVQQHDCHFGTNQQWRVTLVQAANYDVGWELRSVHSNKCLDVAGASIFDQANVQQFTCHSGTAQLWRLDGYHPFRSRPEVTPR